MEYDGGRQFKSAFKREEQVDSLLRRIAEEHPDIKRHSAEAEKKLADKERHREKKLKRTIPDDIRQEIDFLERCALYLEKQPSLFRNLSAAARRKRAYDNSSPAYRWVAMFITLMGAAVLRMAYIPSLQEVSEDSACTSCCSDWQPYSSFPG